MTSKQAIPLGQTGWGHLGVGVMGSTGVIIGSTGSMKIGGLVIGLRIGGLLIGLTGNSNSIGYSIGNSIGYSIG